ncbi:MAG TPA: ABC transporter substrate-binding protein [Chloroflexota bacterium]|nr:ABC transporter substrate-binding protein [Chloroflexota bacterium]
MQRRAIVATTSLLLGIFVVACTQGGTAALRNRSADAASARPGPTHATIVSFRDLDFQPYSAVPGSYELRNAVNPGLVVVDDRNTLRPVLAEAVPTLDNGLWKLRPDGTMETTWTIRPEAVWHDGSPILADDLAFTIKVGRDRSTGVFGLQAYRFMGDVDTPDPRTVHITWSEPYIDADQTFSIWLAWPMPKHVLETIYDQDPTSLSQASYWTTDYVGSGAYQLKDFVPGQRISLQAFDRFVLGRPKIDEIDVEFNPDPSSVMANALAGAVDATIGIGFAIDSVVEMRDRWADGRFTFEFSDHRWYRLDPQFIDPTPSIITNLQFRQALLYAIDRQEMVDSLEAGLSPVATTFMAPNQPDYAGIEGGVKKYEYDPRKAAQMIGDLGYRRGDDGFMHDAAGQLLEVEIAGSNQAVTKPMLAVADYWQKIGVSTTSFVVPAQRATDWPWRATFTGFALFTGTHDVDGLPALKSSQARTAENNYEVSGLPNWPRYRSPVLDDLVDRYFRTIPKPERIEVLTQINEHIFENLSTMPLYYFPTPYAVANRLANVPVNRASRASLTWNIHQWDVKR